MLYHTINSHKLTLFKTYRYKIYIHCNRISHSLQNWWKYKVHRIQNKTDISVNVWIFYLSCNLNINKIYRNMLFKRCTSILKKKKKNQHILTHKQILLFDTISKIPRQHCDTTMKALYIQWGYSKTNTCISQRKSMIAG